MGVLGEPGAAPATGAVEVLDLTAEADADVPLERRHHERWGAEHGGLPEDCRVLLRTGWSAPALVERRARA